MAFNDILCPIFSMDADEPVLNAADAVAEIANARIKALVIEVQPTHNCTVEGAEESDVSADMLGHRHRKLAATKFKRRPATFRPREYEVREIAISADGAHAAAMTTEAQMADLTIMLRPGEAPLEDLRLSIAEQLLFVSGRPLLLIPPNWRGDQIGRNVVVGWNGTREAARALGDAEPLLQQASSITVVYVALGEARARGVSSAQSVVDHLTRRGKHAKLRHAGELGFSDGATLFGQAEALGADLVVMGGYGTPRLLERIVGGVTREALKKATIPVLMSH